MISLFSNNHKPRTQAAFTIVEVATAVVLAGVFVLLFTESMKAYQRMRHDSEAQSVAYSVAKELAIDYRGMSSGEGEHDCTVPDRHAVEENQAIDTDIYTDAAELIEPKVSIYSQYVNGCAANPRTIITVSYGPNDRRSSVESIAE